MMWSFSGFGEKIAIVDESGDITSYAQLQAASEFLISHISERVIVFSLCTNEKGSLLGYTSFINTGIVPVMLDATLDISLLMTLINEYKPDYIWLPQSMADLLPDYTMSYSVWGYSLLKTPYNKVYPLSEDLALLLTTSGSTGSPKLVRQSYANIRANTESIVEYLHLDATERPITTMPMSYTYGLSIINSHLWVGASIILTQKTMMQKEFWQQF